MNFGKKVVIVTGAGEGIGRAVAEKYGEDGAFVIVADIDSEAGKETRDCIIKNNGNAVFVKTDVAKEEDCKNLAEEAVKKYGRIDILINNAGIANAKKAGIFGEGMEEFDRVISVNLRGTFMCSKYCIPFMKAGSSIVNISSTRAFMSEPETEAYSASKGGITALTHSMAVSLSEKNIRVNSISPGWIDVSGWKKGGQKGDILSEADHKQHPAGRVGKPEDIAAACFYLTRQEAGFITGTNLNVDGGMTVKMIYV
ncbi:glucose 1-dehydrogenase [Sebaldella sp. S0638]|uniref:glucose 1-dehydrogenase n=1 Tax=Sebaldella sp. S0638 TaxID=2957809 RepID=UPI0020A13212|nr:SDR family oxidoreductase [Sebaldella sp. S0638]MCP1226364.1 SDR family oxidoreductase [Sebaldella sp. S0638]